MVEANIVDPQEVKADEDRSAMAEVKYFGLDQESSFVQCSYQIPEERYNAMIQDKDGNVSDNKGKVLCLVLDTSGSMSGSPMRALQAGVRQIGEAFYSGAE